ncbi:MAG: hypothetical protein FWD78_02660 [Treponema sp.]|nr:hypothetical protein [Treponema sp.]
MIKKILLGVVWLTAAAAIYGQTSLSGTLDSTLNYTFLADSPHNSFGLQEFANIRLRIKTGDYGSIYAAFNAAAVTGNFAANPSYIQGENYAAVLEPERLYFRVNGDYVDAEAGLLRLNFGYGQVWGPSDFLTSRSPLSANARPRGVLGLDFSVYPTDTMKLLFFAAAPKSPAQITGGGYTPGLTLDKHWDMASLQLLYSYQTPLAGFDYGLHMFGFSLKADLEVGLVADALYVLNTAAPDGIEGLSASAGFDYSFLGGDFYTLWEYLYSGSASVSSASGYGTGVLLNHHYLYGSLIYRINDYTRTGISSVYCFDSPSFFNSAFIQYEIYQGFTLSLNLRLPADMLISGGAKNGELGPVKAGYRFSMDIGAGLRF